MGDSTCCKGLRSRFRSWTWQRCGPCAHRASAVIIPCGTCGILFSDGSCCEFTSRCVPRMLLLFNVYQCGRQALPCEKPSCKTPTQLPPSLRQAKREFWRVETRALAGPGRRPMTPCCTQAACFAVCALLCASACLAQAGANSVPPPEVGRYAVAIQVCVLAVSGSTCVHQKSLSMGMLASSDYKYHCMRLYGMRWLLRT